MQDEQKVHHILEQFAGLQQPLTQLKDTVTRVLGDSLSQAGVPVTSLTSRVKGAASLEGKVRKKLHKYNELADITDLLGVRIITLYSDDVDKVAALVEKLFTIDWTNSVDKRKMHDVNNFGYLSLHYICQVPESIYCDPACPELNTLKFEIQMRSTMQHMWAEVEHDIRYKTSVGIPQDYSRMFGRLAGMLELVDEEFCRMRNHMADYRRRMTEMMAHGPLDDIELNAASWASYLRTEPFATLNQKILAINQGELFPMPLDGFADTLRQQGFTTLGDVDRLIKLRTDDALHLIRYKMSSTDLDIVSSATAVQMLLIADALTRPDAAQRLPQLLATLYGAGGHVAQMAEDYMALARKLSITPQ